MQLMEKVGDHRASAGAEGAGEGEILGVTVGSPGVTQGNDVFSRLQHQ